MIRISDDKRAVIDCESSTALVVGFSELEGRRRWLKTGGFQFEPTRYNLDLVKKAAADYNVIDERPSPYLSETREPPVFGYFSKTVPYAHQLDALERVRGIPFYALFCEPGTGKSKIAIDAMSEKWASGKIEAAIVVAPKGVHEQWAEQIDIHSGLPAGVSTYRSGRVSKLNIANGDINWLLINYDALATAKGREFVNNFVRAFGSYGLVVDESHMIKNPNSRRWKNVYALRRLGKCRAALLLTGTPIAKNLVDEWSQLKLLNEDILGIRYVSAFKGHFCIMGGYQGRDVVGARNLNRFKSLTRPYVFRVRKSDLPDIPPRVYSEFNFEMTTAQRNTYRGMARDLLVEIESGEISSAANAAVKINRLQQISNGFLVTEDGIGKSLFKHPRENPRVEALLELIEAEDRADPVIVWCRYQFDVRLVAEALGDRAVTYYGGLDETARKNNLNSWLNGLARFLVATPGTGGVGLNLQTGGCVRAIYFSNSENSIQRWQSEDRIHRIGSKGSVTYVDLIARGSRDRSILANLRAKKSLSDLALDDIAGELRAITKG